MGDAPRDGREPESDGAAERRSIGRYLASQRQLRGISLDELAASTRIPRRNLERLEAGAFDAQPDGFVRGFVRTVAEELGLDAHETVMRLAREPTAGDEEAHRRRVRAWAAGLLVAGALVAALGWGVRLAARWLAAPPADSVEHVYRRDAVRSLVESGGSGAARPTAPAAPSPAEEAAGAEDAPSGAAAADPSSAAEPSGP